MNVAVVSFCVLAPMVLVTLIYLFSDPTSAALIAVSFVGLAVYSDIPGATALYRQIMHKIAGIFRFGGADEEEVSESDDEYGEEDDSRSWQFAFNSVLARHKALYGPHNVDASDRAPFFASGDVSSLQREMSDLTTEDGEQSRVVKDRITHSNSVLEGRLKILSEYTARRHARQLAMQVRNEFLAPSASSASSSKTRPLSPPEVQEPAHSRTLLGSGGSKSKDSSLANTEVNGRELPPVPESPSVMPTPLLFPPFPISAFGDESHNRSEALTAAAAIALGVAPPTGHFRGNTPDSPAIGLGFSPSLVPASAAAAAIRAGAAAAIAAAGAEPGLALPSLGPAKDEAATLTLAQQYHLLRKQQKLLLGQEQMQEDWRAPAGGLGMGRSVPSSGPAPPISSAAVAALLASPAASEATGQVDKLDGDNMGYFSVGSVACDGDQLEQESGDADVGGIWGPVPDMDEPLPSPDAVSDDNADVLHHLPALPPAAPDVVAPPLSSSIDPAAVSPSAASSLPSGNSQSASPLSGSELGTELSGPSGPLARGSGAHSVGSSECGALSSGQLCVPDVPFVGKTDETVSSVAISPNTGLIPSHDSGSNSGSGFESVDGTLPNTDSGSNDEGTFQQQQQQRPRSHGGHTAAVAAAAVVASVG